MDPVTAVIAGFILLILLLVILEMPVGFALALVGFIGYGVLNSFDTALNMIASSFHTNLTKFSLTAIPLFILMGNVAQASGVNDNLYKSAYKWFGHLKGGLASATVTACAAFAMICGSNTATAATMSAVALPQMKKYQYDDRLSTGAVGAGSTLGVIIPPSVVLIILGLSTGQDIGSLFYGAFGAGILLYILMIATVIVLSYVKKDFCRPGERFTLKEKLASLKGAIEMVILFVLMMAGLYGGFFTPTEAGAVGAFLAIVIGLVQGKLKWAGFKKAVKDSLVSSCMTIMIVAGASIFGRFLTIARVPNMVAEGISGLHLPSWGIMLVIFFMYIAGGALMDALALLLITVPIFFPLVEGMGYDPLWFAVIITVITSLGAITPPVGATTYVVAGSAKGVPLGKVFKGVSYFIPAYLTAIVLMLIFPSIITFFGNLG